MAAFLKKFKFGRRDKDLGDQDGPTGFLRFVENKISRIGQTVVLEILLLMNLVLAIITVRSTDKLNAPCAFHIVFTIGTMIAVGMLLWRQISSFSKNMAYFNFALNVILSIVWAIAFLWLAIANVKSGDDDDDDKDNKDNKDDKSNRRLLLVRADDKKDDDDAANTVYGCIILGVFFMAFFIFNTIYIQTRLRKTFPKYAQADDSHAFDPHVNDPHADEEHELGMKPPTHGDYDNHSPERHEYHSPERPDYQDAPHDHYAEAPEPTAYDPLGHEGGHMSPPPRTGYSPQGYMTEPTAYQPPHHDNYSQQIPPAGYIPPAGADPNSYTPYHDDSHARTGHYQY